MSKRRSERTRKSPLALFANKAQLSQPEFDEDNRHIFASRYGYDCAYPALKIFRGYHSPGYDLQTHGYLHVMRNGLWGLCDDKGKEILPCEYEDLDFVRLCMHFCVLPVKKGGKWGCVWINQEVDLLPCIYDNIFMDEYRFPDSLGCIMDGKEGLLSCINGEWQLPCEYKQLRPTAYTTYPILIAEKNDKFGLVSSRNGEVYLPIEYDKIYRGHNIYYAVKDNDIIALTKESFPDLYKEPKC